MHTPLRQQPEFTEHQSEYSVDTNIFISESFLNTQLVTIFLKKSLASKFILISIITLPFSFPCISQVDIICSLQIASIHY